MSLKLYDSTKGIRVSTMEVRHRKANRGQAAFSLLLATLVMMGPVVFSISRIAEGMVRNSLSFEERGKRSDLLSYLRGRFDCRKTLEGLDGHCQAGQENQSSSVYLRDSIGDIVVGTSDTPITYGRLRASARCRRIGGRYEFYVSTRSIVNENSAYTIATNWKTIHKVPFTCE